MQASGLEKSTRSLATSCRLLGAGFHGIAGAAGLARSAFGRATRVENACATGSAAVHQGPNAIGEECACLRSSSGSSR
jgi:hypothetical protein